MPVGVGTVLSTAIGLGLAGAAAKKGSDALSNFERKQEEALKPPAAPIQVPTSATDSTPATEIASPIPIEDNELVRRNARRDAARRSAKSGRVSTFLSGDKMGG